MAVEERLNRAALWCRAAWTGFLFVLAAPAPAQMDPSGDWRTWHTEHFRVHARVGHTESAERFAREAERAYALFATELPTPRGTIERGEHP